ncbi:MAG: ABC transporter [Deltaproteobacteria bacterium]|nr:ABC transporter [Deltaproteobacteria bacterium]
MSAKETTAPSRLASDAGAILALWQRDLKHLARERTRWLGVVIQPLLIWALLGLGMGDVFKVDGLDGLDYLTFFYPGVIIMVILFTTVFATMAVIEDRTQGFLQQMAVAPASRASMVLGKVAGVTTVAMVQAALCLAIAPLAGFSLGAIAWPELIVALILGSMGLTSLSFCLAWLVTSTHAYHALMSVFLLPLWMVSGAMFPAPESGVVRIIMDLNPMTYCVETVRHALHGGTAEVAAMTPTFAMTALAGFTVGMTLIAIWLTTRVQRWRP